MSRDRSYRPTAFWANKANAGRRRDFGARVGGRNPQMRNRRGSVAAVASWPNGPNGGKRKDYNAPIGARENSAIHDDLRCVDSTPLRQDNSRLCNRRALMASVASWPNKPNDGKHNDSSARFCRVGKGARVHVTPIAQAQTRAPCPRAGGPLRTGRGVRAARGHAAHSSSKTGVNALLLGRFAHPTDKEKT
jgi:hypothetical protein